MPTPKALRQKSRGWEGTRPPPSASPAAVPRAPAHTRATVPTTQLQMQADVAATKRSIKMSTNEVPASECSRGLAGSRSMKHLAPKSLGDPLSNVRPFRFVRAATARRRCRSREAGANKRTWSRKARAPPARRPRGLCGTKAWTQSVPTRVMRAPRKSESHFGKSSSACRHAAHVRERRSLSGQRPTQHDPACNQHSPPRLLWANAEHTGDGHTLCNALEPVRTTSGKDAAKRSTWPCHATPYCASSSRQETCRSPH